VQQRGVGGVPAEPETLCHLLVAGALVGAPLAGLGGLEAVFRTVALVVAQVVDLGSGLCQGYPSGDRNGAFRHPFALREKGTPRREIRRRRSYYRSRTAPRSRGPGVGSDNGGATPNEMRSPRTTAIAFQFDAGRSAVAFVRTTYQLPSFEGRTGIRRRSTDIDTRPQPSDPLGTSVRSPMRPQEGKHSTPASDIARVRELILAGVYSIAGESYVSPVRLTRAVRRSGR
jgi:hypothetical protein